MLVGTTLLGLALAAPAYGAPATPEGAKAIANGLARYFGRWMDKGLVTVKPSGDAYDVIFEFDSAKLGMPADGPQVHFGPFTTRVAPKDGNIFAVDYNIPTLDFSYKGAKAGPLIEATQQIRNCIGDGLFDATGLYFVKQSMTCESSVLAFRSPLEDVDATLGKATFTSSGKASGAGDVDVSVAGDVLDLVETITVKDPSNPPPPAVMRADQVHEEFVLNGIRNAQVMDALAFFAARKPDDNSKAAQDGAKAKIQAALPLWQSMSAEIRYDNASVGTPKGIVKATSIDTTFTSGGVIKDAVIGAKLALSGLELPGGMVPDWAASLVPTNATLNLKLSKVDLAGIADKMINDYDVQRTAAGGEHDAIKSAILAVLMGNPPHLTFDQTLTAPVYDVKGLGETSLFPDQQGKATISSSSLDAMMTALGTGSVTGVGPQRAAMGLAFLKGLAKTGPDGRLTWDVDFDSLAKKVTVNGQSFGPGAK